MTRREIQKVLQESVYSPGKKGPFKVILENNNPDYLEIRSIEYLNDALKFVDRDRKLYEECITKAISLLATAKLMRRKNESIQT